MSELHFDKFGSEGELLRPYDEIGVGLRVCYAQGAISRLALAAGRKSEAWDERGELQRYIIVDANNFTIDDWFALEIWWPDDCHTLEMRMRAYPCTHFNQRLYFNNDDHDGQAVDLPQIAATDSFFTYVFHKEDLYRNNGLPRSAHNLRINLMVPASEWFVLGIMSLKRHGHAGN